MTNFDVARSALETSLNSSGSALAEHSKWSQSLEAHLLSLQAAWQGLSQSFMNSNFLKGALDGVIALVDGVTSLIDTFGTLPTLLGAFAAFESFKGIGLFKTIEDEATLSGKRITNIFSDAARQTAKTFQTIGLKTDSSFKASIDADIKAFSEYADLLKQTSQLGIEIDENAFNNIFKNASESAKEFAKNGDLSNEAIRGFIQSQKEAQVSTLAQNKSLGNANAIIKEYFSGCKNVEMSQESFASAVGKTNPQLEKQLTTARGAKGALAGYVTSLVGAKVASFALEAATMALNTALTMGISALISFGIKMLDEWIVTSKELAESVDEVTSKYKEQHGELIKLKGDYDTSNENSMISRYEKLSKGVNGFGENISLTADEYSEYQSIVNSIADQIPSLISGYDSQGNAILSCKGNVEELTAAYEKLIEAQNNEIFTNAGNIRKDFKNVVEDTKDSWLHPFTASSRHMDALRDIYEGGDIDKIYDKILGDDKGQHNSNWSVAKLLEDAGYDMSWKAYTAVGSDEVKKALKDIKDTNPDILKSIVDDYYATLEAEIEGMQSIAQATLSKAFDFRDSDYAHLGEGIQTLAKQVVGSFDYDFYANLLSNETYKGDVEKYINDMLDVFDNLGAGEAANFEAAFDLKTRFNSGDISYGEYVKGIQDAEKLVENLELDEEVESQIKLILNTEEVTENYEALRKRLADKYKHETLKSFGTNSIGKVELEIATKEAEEKAEKFLSGLSASEYQVAVDLIANGEIDLSDFDIKSLKEYIEKQAKLNDAMNFTIAMDVEVESVEALNTAMAESVSGAGLSSEAIAALKGRYAELASQGYDLSAMFEETANGIHLNRSAVDELERAYASDKLTETEGHLEVLKGRYDELTNEINNCTDAGERASLYSEQQQIVQKINDLGTLAAQYEGLASAYQTWQGVESSGSERDMYESIIEGFETVGDEIKRGWLDDGTIKFLELITGETDLATKSASELKEVWNSLDDTIKGTSYSIKDFFTVDEDGNSTSTGAYNFLRAVEQLGKNGTLKALKGQNINDLIVRNDKDKIVGFDFNVVGGDEAVAEALGVSEEMVQIIQRALDDAGFVVTLDGKYTLLADLKTSAEEANNTLKKLKTEGLENLKNISEEDLNFDFDASSLTALNDEFAKANKVLDQFKDKNGQLKKDAKGNLVKGAQEALDIAMYYQATIDKLTEPVYMQLETNQVEENLQEPLEKMQEFEGLVKEKHMLTLAGDTKGLEETEKKMDEIAKWLENLDEDTKVELDIDGLSTEEIKSKLEKGEIEIPATVDIQLEMSEDIKDMRLLMMNQLDKSLVSDAEIKLKIGYEIDDSTVDKLDDKEQEVVIKYIEENEEAWNKLSEEEREAVVKIVADGTDIENWEAEEKEALVKYVVDGGEVDDWSPEEKQAFAKYLVDGGEVEGWSPEAKDAFVKYLVDGGDPDKFDPDDKESWVVYKKDSSEPDGYNPDDPEATVIYKKNSLVPDSYIPNNPDATVTYDKNSTVPDSYNPDDPDATVKYGKDSLIPDNYIPLDPPATVIFDKDTSIIDSYDPPNFVRTVTYKIKEIVSKIASGGKSKAAQRSGADPDGKGTVNGTANVNGTAFAIGTMGRAYKQGYWGTKDSGVALGNELGMETIVRDGHYFTIGDGNAQFFKYKKGDIIFNHKQTEELFKHGKVTSGGGHGKVYANGTAFSKGTGGGIEPEATSIVVGTNKSTGKTYTKSTDKDSSKDFEETFDLIEIAIKRIEREIDNLDQKANRTYKSWSSRNSALASEISKVGSEISLQQKAYNEYMAAANGVGLSSSWKKKVQNGEVDIETVKDEVLAEKIGEYEDWYNKALDCKDAIEDLRDTEAELYRQRFDHIQSQYDGILQGYEHTETMLNEYISQAEAQGHIVSKKYYDALISNEKSNIAQLKKEQAALIKSRDEAVASGKIAKNSEEWIDMCNNIDEVTQAIESGTTSLLEYAKAIDEINWEVFDLIQERISDITAESDFLIELMSNDKLFDDNGKLTGQGAATMGLHALNYNTNMYAADEYGAEVAKLDKQIAKDPYDQELINRRNELLELQRESILAAEQEKQAIADLVQDGIDMELDALSELIDKKNESLEAEKDLYEYSKKVSEQTENIASLRKQMAAYENDNSEEAKAKIQELKVSLSEAEADLEATEWDKYIQDTEQILDTLYTDYETILNSRLDNIDGLLQQVIDGINTAAGLSTEQNANLLASLGAEGTLASALGVEGAIASAIVNAMGENGSIKNILNKEVTAVGTTLSSAMNSIWSVGDGNAKSVLTMYGEDFKTKSTTTNTTLNSIKTSVDNMVASLNKEAEKKVTANKTTTSAKKDPTKTTTTTTTKKPATTTTNKTTSSGDGKAKVGDKVKFVSGKYYYDSYGTKPLGSKNQGKYVYITHINTKGSHPYHISTGNKLGKGDLGWLKLNQISGYASGKKKISDSEYAWTQENGQEFIVRPSDGAILTPVAKGDSVLNATASGNIWNMANNPAEFIKNNLGLDNANIPNGANIQNSYVQHFDNITFHMPNVKDYDSLLAQMQKDKNFERLVTSMTTDRITGRSALAKGKAIR